MRQFKIRELNEFYHVTVTTSSGEQYRQVWALVPQLNLVQRVLHESRGQIQGWVLCDDYAHRTSLSRLTTRYWWSDVQIDQISVDWFEDNFPQALDLVIATPVKRYSPEKQAPVEESIRIDHLKWSEERHRIHADLMNKGFDWTRHQDHGSANSFDFYRFGQILIYVYPVSSKWYFVLPNHHSVGGKGHRQLMSKIETWMPYRFLS